MLILEDVECIFVSEALHCRLPYRSACTRPLPRHSSCPVIAAFAEDVRR